MRALLFVLLLTLTGAAGAAPPPLSGSEARALDDLEEDPPPVALVDGKHFVVSNERHLERFYQPARGRGGMLVGIGAEQSYLFAGWARPELTVLIDFDRWVADVHEIHRVAFLSAATPEAYLKLWSAAEATRLWRLLAAKLPAGKAVRAQRLLTIVQPAVHKRLGELRRKYAHRKIGSYLTDPEQYRYVAALQQAGRVVALCGDLTGRQSMLSIGRLARRLGLIVRVLYLSNAEEYFAYTAQVRQNIAALPFDEHSVVLRTLYLSRGSGFVYATQQANDFKRWLERPEVLTVRAIAGSTRLSRQHLVTLPGPT